MRIGSPLRLAALGAAFWTGIAVLFALPRLAQGGALAASLAEWWAWGLLAPAIMAVDTRLPFSGRQMGRRLLAHLVLGPIFTVCFVYLAAALSALLGVGSWHRVLGWRLLLQSFQGSFPWGMVVYCLIVGVWEAYIYNRQYLAAELRSEKLERSFSEARLNALRMQLDPHFLFNALNTISAQVAQEPRVARKMIEHLGDLLRLSLDSTSRHEITLQEELAFLDHYLAIQKIRFGEKLRVHIDVAPEARYAAVPSMLMQPLVENAIRHGFSSRASGGAVTVTATRAQGKLEIHVLDDGVGLPAGWDWSNLTGLGLSVTRERITGLNPDGTSAFLVRNRPDGGTEVAISFPFRLLGAPA